MHWSGEHDRLTDEQLAMHKRQLARLNDAELQRSYAMYVRALDKGEPPVAAKVQYFANAGGNCVGGSRMKS